MKERLSSSKAAFLAVAITLAVSTSWAQSVQVLQRARLGNETEDITFIGNGPLAGNIAILDGYEVGGVLVQGCADCPAPHKLFDLRRLGINYAPRGMAYLESARLFAVADPSQLTTLFLVDDHGRPKGTRTIQYLGGFFPVWLEGSAYIPKTSPSFPDDLIQVAIIFSPQESRLEVLQHDGQVAAEIIPAEPLHSSYISGVSFLAPGRILVTTGNTIWAIDFAGNILAGPVTLYGAGSIEGVVQVSSGDIVAADFNAGTLFFFDKNLNRLPGKDRNYKIGVGVSVPTGVAWNSDTNQHLVAHAGVSPAQKLEIVSIPSALNDASQVVDLGAYGLYSGHITYLPDEHLIASANRTPPRAIVLFDNNGNQVEQIDVSAFGKPNAITYIPTTKQFAVEFRENPLVVQILDRNGNLVRTIDLSTAGISSVGALTFFKPSDPSGGRFLMIVNDATQTFQQFAMITDFNGTLLGKFDVRKTFGLLQAADVSTISSGPQAGAFAIVDSGNSEIVIFRLQ